VLRPSQTRLGTRIVWLLLLLLSSYYLYRAFRFRFLTPDQLGPSFLHKQVWYVSHLLAALVVFIGGPLQFSSTLRTSRPGFHRLIGRLYVGGATLAALTAIYLGATIEYEGSRLPIVLLGLLWLFFTLAAWRCALARNFAAHRLFMIRSYGLALVLVWLRLMSDLQGWLFFYVQDEAMRDATREWASWVIPLLVLELWLSWLPAVRRGPRRLASKPASSEPSPASGG
jgi:uncharacterized membrane protein